MWIQHAPIARKMLRTLPKTECSRVPDFDHPGHSTRSPSRARLPVGVVKERCITAIRTAQPRFHVFAEEDDMRGPKDVQNLRPRRLLGIERPNEFLCFLFSCFNDPTAPPSTDMLLSLKLLEDWVDMGLRGDARINAEGLMYSVSDVSDKLEGYLAFLEGSRVAIRNETVRWQYIAYCAEIQVFTEPGLKSHGSKERRWGCVK